MIGMAWTEQGVYEALDEVFRDVFDDDAIQVGPSTSSADIEDWDSLEHINLVVAVEQRFGMRFTMAEVQGMANVGEMVPIILERARS